MIGELPPQQIVTGEILDWRCGSCAIRPLLGKIGLVGGVHIRVSGRRSYQLHIVVDVIKGKVWVHCPACHHWRRVQWDAETQAMQEQDDPQFFPLVGCSCEFERYAQAAAQRRLEDRNGRIACDPEG